MVFGEPLLPELRSSRHAARSTARLRKLFGSRERSVGSVVHHGLVLSARRRGDVVDQPRLELLYLQRGAHVSRTKATLFPAVPDDLTDAAGLARQKHALGKERDSPLDLRVEEEPAGLA